MYRRHPRRVPRGRRLPRRAQRPRTTRCAAPASHPAPSWRAVGHLHSGLARGGVTEALTTEQIDAPADENPEWLCSERATQAEVRKETVRIKEKRAEQAAKAADKV